MTASEPTAEALAAFVSPLLLRALAVWAPGDSPATREIDVAAALVDIEGFTALTERYAEQGTAGLEELADLVNQWFGWLLATIFRHGGAVHSFAGDSVVALWEASGCSLAEATQRAAACALEIGHSWRSFALPECRERCWQ